MQTTNTMACVPATTRRASCFCRKGDYKLANTCAHIIFYQRVIKVPDVKKKFFKIIIHDSVSFFALKYKYDTLINVPLVGRFI